MLSERRCGNEGIEIDLYQVMDILTCDTSRRANVPVHNDEMSQVIYNPDEK